MKTANEWSFDKSYLTKRHVMTRKKKHTKLWGFNGSVIEKRHIITAK